MQRTFRHTLALAGVLAAALGAAACGAADDAAAPGGEGSTAAPASTAPATTAPATTAGTTGAATSAPVIDGVPHPTGPTDVVLRVTVDGGYVPTEYALRTLPTYTLYGDGTVIVAGPVPAIYPGPAVQPLLVGQVDEAAVQEALVAARDAGILGDDPIAYGDMGTIGIADAPTTTLEIVTDAGTTTRQAYALSIDAGGQQLPADVAAARTALADLIAALPQPATTEDYAPEALRVFVGPYQGDPEAAGAPVVWPLAGDLATLGEAMGDFPYRCAVVDGADVATLTDTLATANEQSQWIAAPDRDATFRVVVRPLLPDEQGCPAV